MISTERSPFKPVAVFIPTEAVPESGSVVDPKDCTLLHLDGDGNEGLLYTREEWESGAEEGSYYRNGGRDSGKVDGGEIHLLPDMVVVKFPEREYWSDDIQARTKEVYSIYAIDRRKHVHICSVTPSYEAYYIGTEFDPIDDLTDEQGDELHSEIMHGAACANEQFSYFDVRSIDRALENVCRPGWFPPGGKRGGYPFTTDMVRTEDAYEEIAEVFATSTL